MTKKSERGITGKTDNLLGESQGHTSFTNSINKVKANNINYLKLIKFIFFDTPRLNLPSQLHHLLKEITYI